MLPNKFPPTCETVEVYRNDILSAWQKKNNVEAILISESLNSKIRITSSLFCRSDSYFRIHGFTNERHFKIQVIFSGCQDFISKKTLVAHMCMLCKAKKLLYQVVMFISQHVDIDTSYLKSWLNVH